MVLFLPDVKAGKSIEPRSDSGEVVLLGQRFKPFVPSAGQNLNASFIFPRSVNCYHTVEVYWPVEVKPAA